MNARERRRVRRAAERAAAPPPETWPHCPRCRYQAVKYHGPEVGYLCARGHAFGGTQTALSREAERIGVEP